MDINRAEKIIEKYMNSPARSPLIINTENKQDFQKIYQKLSMWSLEPYEASKLCKDDELLQFDRLLYKVQTSKDLFITEAFEFSKLRGERELKNNLYQIVTLPVNSHIIFLTYQCAPYLQFSDPRIASTNKVILIDGLRDEQPDIYLTSQELLPPDQSSYSGINRIGNAILNTLKNEDIYIITHYSKNAFINSLFYLVDKTDPLSILIDKYPELAFVTKELGEEENWIFTLKETANYKTWAEAQREIFGTTKLSSIIGDYSEYDRNKKWLFFLNLKSSNIDNNSYLKYVVNKSYCIEDFERELYKAILDFDYTDSHFNTLYSERKRILRRINNNQYLTEFCDILDKFKENALYYLTDNSIEEKELIIKLLGRYASSYNSEEVSKILKTIYPDLHYYLDSYNFESDILTNYFNYYKFDKVFNKLSMELESLVKEQAEKREYNRILKSRAQILSKIDKENALIYFIDGLGVEYLSYILQKCKENGLLANISITKSNLPSLTKYNTEFVEELKEEGYPIISIKSLDELKHKGTEDIHYKKSKYPIYLTRELEIIDEIIKNIARDLNNSESSKAIIVSDHGASRFAVLNGTFIPERMNEKGVHSGRCCPVSDLDNIEFDNAEIVNNFYVLADYNRFKGSRKANFEVHGGATLEEITVPIIEIIQKPQEIKAELSKTLFKISPFIKTINIELYISQILPNIQIKIKDEFFKVNSINGHLYNFEIPSKKLKAGKYELEVFSGNNSISKDISFEIEKEGMVVNNLFG